MLGFAVLKNKNGSVLIAISIAIAIVSILFLGMLDNISFQQKNLRTARITKNRDFLQELIQKFTSDYTLISRSINLVGNEKFKACFQGGTYPSCSAAPCCNNGFSGAGNDFILLDPRVPNDIFSPTSGEKFSGTLASPQRFDINGEKCTTPSAECPFVMSTSFEAKCPGNINPCNYAQSITMSYTFGMDRNPSIGPLLAIKTETIPNAQVNLGWDVAWTPIDPSEVILCWTSGAECTSEAYNGDNWVTKVTLPTVPITAKKLLVYYHCYNTNLDFRIWGQTQSHSLCNDSHVHDVGQAWIPLVQDIHTNLKYDIRYNSLTTIPNPPTGLVMIRLIGWSE